MDVRLGLNQLKNQIQPAWTILDKGKINGATFTLTKKTLKCTWICFVLWIWHLCSAFCEDLCGAS